MDKNSVIVVMCVVAFFYGTLLLKPLARGLEQLRKLPKSFVTMRNRTVRQPLLLP